jgi:carboxyl-terminal processing protease
MKRGALLRRWRRLQTRCALRGLRRRYSTSAQNRCPDVSLAAFDLFLKQLDFQKRFLLKEDIAVLRNYVNPSDSDAFATEMKLAEVGSEILAKRVQQVHELEKKIIAADFDFNAKEFIETDSEKLDYCDTLEELRARWVKILKLQILNQYLSLVEDDKSASLSSEKSTACG